MRKKDLMIVDDEPANLFSLSTLFKDAYRIRVFKSGASFLSAIRTQPMPDLVLMDIVMEDMDGYETMRRLREDPANRDIPVIFITAKDDPEDEEQGFRLGAVDYIRKPFMPTSVRERVRVHLDLKDAREILKDKNTWLEDEVRRRVNDVMLIQDATLNVLTQIVETRDIETGHHIVRTSEYVRILADRLALSPKYAHVLTPSSIDMIVRAAPLHDIGKIGVPDRILLKPGKLTPEEFDEIKNHCAYGSKAIRKAINATLRLHPEGASGGAGIIRFLETADAIALHHHERYDGNRYPDGLIGSDIPLPARLMALADVFDALATKRVYKDARPLSTVREEIRSQRGRQFDPDVTDAFLATFDRFKVIASTYVE